MKYLLLICVLIFNMQNVSAQTEKDKYNSIKEKLKGKIFRNCDDNGECTFLKLDVINGSMKVLFRNINGEVGYEFSDGYVISGNEVSFNFFLSNASNGTAFYNSESDKIRIGDGLIDLSNNVARGFYSLVDKNTYDYYDGFYSKRTIMSKLDERKLTDVFCNGNNYIYLYENNKADFITYSKDNIKPIIKQYNASRSTLSNYGTITEELYLREPTQENNYLFFKVGLNRSNTIIWLQSKQGDVYYRCEEKADNEFVQSNKKISATVVNPSKNDFIITPIDYLKKDKKEIIKMYNYFYNSIKPNEINKYYAPYRNEYGQQVQRVNLFEDYDYTVKIDDDENVIYLIFTNKYNNKKLRIFAMDPIIGPLPFVQSDTLLQLTPSLSSNYRATRNLEEDRYRLDFDYSTNTFTPELIGFDAYNRSGNIDAKKITINNSNFISASLRVGSKKESYKYVPSTSEKIQLYNASAISKTDLLNPDFYIIENGESTIYSKFLITYTGYNFALSKSFDEVFPLSNNKLIFKKDGKYGIVDLSEKNWKTRSFITVDNVFDKIVYIKRNVLKGIINNRELYFNYDGYLLLSETTKDNVPPADLTAKTVIDNYIKAIGGKDSVASVKTLMMIGSGSNPELSFQLTFTNKIDSKGKSMIEIASATTSWIKQIVNENEAYIVQRGGQKKYIEGTELVKMKASAIPFEELILSNETDLELSGIKTINGSDAYEIVNGNTTLYYDVKTGLKVKRITFGEKNGNKTVEITNFKDYKEVKGVQIPYNINLIRSADGLNLDIKMSEVKINEGVSDTDFQ